MHGDAIGRYLVDIHGIKPLLECGIEVLIHARYDVPGQSPPDRFVVGAGGAAGDVARQTFHLFNYSGEGTSGFHYDALAPESSSAIPVADANLESDAVDGNFQEHF